MEQKKSVERMNKNNEHELLKINEQMYMDVQSSWGSKERSPQKIG